jgi:hypothetical protein
MSCAVSIGFKGSRFDVPPIATHGESAHRRQSGRCQAWSDIAADRLGEHNEAVLHDLLSLTDKEIAGLYADKVWFAIRFLIPLDWPC